MPWTVANPPSVAKNKTPAEKRACVRAANATLERTGDDGEAIRACLGAMKNVTSNSDRRPAMSLMLQLPADLGPWIEAYNKALALTGDARLPLDTKPDNLESDFLEWLAAEYRRRKKKDGGKGYGDDAELRTFFADLQTGHGDTNHVHFYSPESDWTMPPLGVPDGHRHRIARNAEGRVVGFEQSDNHVHPLFDEFDMGEPITFAAPITDPEGTAELERKLRAGQDAKTYERFSLEDVEIFRVGEWNGDKYTAKDLDDMVASFGEVGFEVPVKVGHSEDSGEPAYGWVSALKRVGDKLVASFRDMPEAIYEAVKERRFDHVSSEIFWNLKVAGKKFRRVLKAVALLGAETPAVSGLKPLRESFAGFTPAELELVHSYNLSRKDIDMPNEPNKGGGTPTQGKTDDAAAAVVAAMAKQLGLAEGASADDIEARLTELATKAAKADEPSEAALEVTRLQETVAGLKTRVNESEAREREAVIKSKVDDVTIPALRPHIEALYRLALDADAPKTVKYTFTPDGAKEPRTEDTDPVVVIDQLVARLKKNTAKLFSEVGVHDDVRRPNAPVNEDPGAEVARLTAAKMANDSTLNYEAAENAVLADPDNAELKQAYAVGRR